MTTTRNRTASAYWLLAIVTLIILSVSAAEPQRVRNGVTLRGSVVSEPFQARSLEEEDNAEEQEEEEESYSYDEEDDDDAYDDDEGDYEAKTYDDDSRWSQYNQKAKSSAKNMFEIPPHQWSPVQWFFFSLMLLAFALLSCCCCVLFIIPRMCGQKGSMMYAAMLT